METGSIVTVNLQNPKEKVFGKLDSISSSGITVRGMDVNSFNDWMNQYTQTDPKIVITPTTMFFPMHRVVSCYLDEDMGEVPSLSSQFMERTKKQIEEMF